MLLEPICISRELVKIQILRLHPRPPESDRLGHLLGEGLQVILMQVELSELLSDLVFVYYVLPPSEPSSSPLLLVCARTHARATDAPPPYTLAPEHIIYSFF